MKSDRSVSRRTAFKTFGALGALLALRPFQTRARTAVGQPHRKPARPADFRQVISDRVFKAPLIDTHEHLVDEQQRLEGATAPGIPCDDWALLLSHYLNSDLLVAGMPQAAGPVDEMPRLHSGQA